MTNLDFDSIAFMQEYNEQKLSAFESNLLPIEIEGRTATYAFEPDNYTLELFVSSNGYVRVGSTNYDKISQSVPLSLKHLEVPINSNVFIVGSEYNADYYVSMPGN